jgi:hypothetical protein
MDKVQKTIGSQLLSYQQEVCSHELIATTVADFCSERRDALRTNEKLNEHQNSKVNTGHTQKNGAVSKVNSFETAPFFCVCPVYVKRQSCLCARRGGMVLLTIIPSARWRWMGKFRNILIQFPSFSFNIPN